MLINVFKVYKVFKGPMIRTDEEQSLEELTRRKRHTNHTIGRAFNSKTVEVRFFRCVW